MGNLRKSLISGVWYVSLAKYSCVVVGLAVTAVLARILTPRDFGTVAIATVFIHLFSTIVTESFSPAIIQNKQLTERDLRAINSFTYLMAFALTGLYLLAVPFIVAYYETEVLSTILTVFAVSIFFSIISIVPNALLMKAKRFRFIAMMSLGIHLALAVMSIAAVTQGMGIYALLVEPVGHGVLLFAVSYAAYPVRWSWPRRESVAKILSFSVFQMLYTAIHIGYRNIDKLLIGKYMGAANLGYYEKSYRLMMLPLENVSSVISPVLHPLLSEYQNDKDYLWEAYKKIIAFMSEFCFIVSVALFFLARFIVILLYGDQWEPAVPVFQVLALSVCFQLMQSPMGAIFLAANAVRRLMVSTLWIFFLMLIGAAGAIGVGSFELIPIVVVLVFLLGFIIYQGCLARLFGKRSDEIYAIMWPHVAYAALLFALLSVVEEMTGEDLWVNGLAVISSVLAYFALLFYTNRIPQLRQMLSFAARKLMGK